MEDADDEDGSNDNNNNNGRFVSSISRTRSHGDLPAPETAAFRRRFVLMQNSGCSDDDDDDVSTKTVAPGTSKSQLLLDSPEYEGVWDIFSNPMLRDFAMHVYKYAHIQPWINNADQLRRLLSGLQNLVSDLKFGAIATNCQLSLCEDPSNLILLTKEQISNPQYLSEIMQKHGAALHPSFHGASNIQQEVPLLVSSSVDSDQARRGRKRSRTQFEDCSNNDDFGFANTPQYCEVKNDQNDAGIETPQSFGDTTDAGLETPQEFVDNKDDDDDDDNDFAMQTLVEDEEYEDSNHNTGNSNLLFSFPSGSINDNNDTKQQREATPTPVKRRGNKSVNVQLPPKPPVPLQTAATTPTATSKIAEPPKKRHKRTSATYIFKNNPNKQSQRALFICSPLSLADFDSLVFSMFVQRTISVSRCIYVC